MVRHRATPAREARTLVLPRELPYRGGSTQIVLQALELMTRLLATMPRRDCVSGQCSLVVRRALKASSS